MASCVIMDDAASIAHFALGIAVHVMPPLYALIAVTLFYVYEIVEDYVTKARGRAKCDIAEFIMGYVTGETITRLQ